jgi:hypothetical protein
MKDIDEAKTQIKPGLDLIRTFRNKHGAHSDRFDILLGTHRALHANKPLIEKSVSWFLAISEDLVEQEGRIFPDFSVRLEAFIQSTS